MHPKTYFIKKQILASSPKDALNREKQAEITDVWREQEEEEKGGSYQAIGFSIYDDDEDY